MIPVSGAPFPCRSIVKLLPIQLLKATNSAFTFTPPNTQGYFANNNGIRYDIAHAQQLLSEAGFPNSEGFRNRIDLQYQ